MLSLAPRFRPMNPPASPAPDLASVYAELRTTARRMLRQEPYLHTLESCELVHQAWARLLNGDLAMLATDSPREVLALAVLNMRRELVDHARKRRAAKRPDPTGRIQLEDASLMLEQDPDALIEIDRLLTSLADAQTRVREGARKAEICRYAFYAGLSGGEIATLLDLPKSTVTADIRFVRAWLAAKLGTPPAA
jgi:RNA polymerase sigma factor (TIGR02999 family)